MLLGLVAAAEGRADIAQAAMAKWYAPRVAVDAIESAMTLYGHIAWSDELPIAQRLRDTMGFLIGDGTAEIQKLIIAREYIGPQGWTAPRRPLRGGHIEEVLNGCTHDHRPGADRYRVRGGGAAVLVAEAAGDVRAAGPGAARVREGRTRRPT